MEVSEEDAAFKQKQKEEAAALKAAQQRGKQFNARLIKLPH